MATTMFSYNLNLNASISGAGWVDLPVPSEVSPEFLQIVTESKRTVGKGAKMHKQLLAMKRKFNCTWHFLKPKEYAKLETLFNGHNFFLLRYQDLTNPYTGSTPNFKTGVFYGGDLKASNIHRVDPKTFENTGFREITWNFIEQ